MADNPFLKDRPAKSPPAFNPFLQDAPPPRAEPPGMAEDMLRSAGAGIRRGIEGLAGMAGDVGRAQASLTRRGLLALGAPESVADTVSSVTALPQYLPSSKDVGDFTDPMIGPSYEPQTTQGEYSRTVGEFLPGIVGPGGPVKWAARGATDVLIPALASETAGQLTEGTKYEPWARAGAGLLAGGVAGGAKEELIGRGGAESRAAEIAAEEAARPHGVQLTKGQRSGDVTQQAAEQQMLHGTNGTWAQRRMQAREQENTAALNSAMERVADTTAPTRGTDPVQSGDLLNQQVRGRVADLRQRGGQGITDALNSGIMVDADRLRNLPGSIRQNLAGPVPYIPDIVLGPNTPIANEAMDRIGMFAGQANDPAVREFSLAGAENLRQRISSLQAQPGSNDARALGRIRDHLDEWIDQSVPQGSPVAAELQTARDTYRAGARIDRPRRNERQQPGAKQVSDLALTNHPEDTRRLFTPNDRGTLSSYATDAIERLRQTGATRGEFDQVRGIILDQLNAGFPGKRATRIENFINENPTAARALFTPEELADIGSIGTTSRRLVPDARATNPSKTSYSVVKEMKKAAAQELTGKATAIGGILGGFGGAVAGGAAGLTKNAYDLFRNYQAVSEALAPADRRTLATLIQAAVAKGGARGAAVGSTDERRK